MAQSHGRPREAGRQAGAQRPERLAINSAANTESSCEDAIPLLSDTGLYRLAVGASAGEGDQFILYRLEVGALKDYSQKVMLHLPSPLFGLLGIVFLQQTS